MNPVCRHCHHPEPAHCQQPGCRRCPKLGDRRGRPVMGCPIHGGIVVRRWRDHTWSPDPAPGRPR